MHIQMMLLGKLTRLWRETVTARVTAQPRAMQKRRLAAQRGVLTRSGAGTAREGRFEIRNILEERLKMAIEMLNMRMTSILWISVSISIIAKISPTIETLNGGSYNKITPAESKLR